MEQEKTLQSLLEAWSQVAWGNKEIMICLNVGMTTASKIHRDAKLHKGLFRGGMMKNKVKADVVCERMGIDRKAEIQRILNYLREDTREYGNGRII